MIVALNNKCNLTKEEFIEYQNNLKEVKTKNKMILCPTTINILNFSSSNNCYLGAQNVSKDDKGAHTGEISADILKTFGVAYCIVGHSERREAGETFEEVREKIQKLYEQNITPILCIGESLKERENNQYKEVINDELSSAIEFLNEEQKNKLIVAYEPIWSIGTGIIPTNDQIEEVFKLIKEILPQSKVLYGGSANEKNIDSLKECPSIDGYLLGGLSLKPKELQVFIEKLEKK